MTPRHLALACALPTRPNRSRSRLVPRMAGPSRSPTEALACGPAWPSGEADRDARVAAGEAVSPLFHNCSGKHAGLLSVCHCPSRFTITRMRPTRCRRRSGARSARSSNAPIDIASLGVDGCNLPAIPLTLQETATAVALAAGDGVNAAQGEAMLRPSTPYVAIRTMSGRGQDTEIVCEATGDASSSRPARRLHSSPSYRRAARDRHQDRRRQRSRPFRRAGRAARAARPCPPPEQSAWRLCGVRHSDEQRRTPRRLSMRLFCRRRGRRRKARPLEKTSSDRRAGAGRAPWLLRRSSSTCV